MLTLAMIRGFVYDFQDAKGIVMMLKPTLGPCGMLGRTDIGPCRTLAHDGTFFP